MAFIAAIMQCLRRHLLRDQRVSRAFVKEGDGADGEELPELKLSPHRNLVTPEGLAQIESQVERLQTEWAAARTAQDRADLARVQRDLRYWNARRGSAEVVAAARATGKVRFGSAVELEKADGVRIAYRIVGEDEADPGRGKISYVSPIARALIGKAEGVVVALPGGEATITAIDRAPRSGG